MIWLISLAWWITLYACAIVSVVVAARWYDDAPDNASIYESLCLFIFIITVNINSITSLQIYIMYQLLLCTIHLHHSYNNVNDDLDDYCNNDVVDKDGWWLWCFILNYCRMDALLSSVPVGMVDMRLSVLYLSTKQMWERRVR
jgi:hypothetical protein